MLQTVDMITTRRVTYEFDGYEIMEALYRHYIASDSVIKMLPRPKSTTITLDEGTDTATVVLIYEEEDKKAKI